MPRRRFDPDEQGVSPRTLSDVQPGSAVIVRDASGKLLSKIATTGVTEGDRFLVVWVARPEEASLAAATRRKPDAVPWPAEDVRVPSCEPGEIKPEDDGECPACSDLDYGACRCTADCGHLNCTGGWR